MAQSTFWKDPDVGHAGHGAERMLDDLHGTLRAGRSRPAPVRRREIPRPDGGVRPLGIPAVRDRVVQQTAKLVPEPIVEAGFLPVSYGYGPRRSATAALDRDQSSTCVARRVSDRRVQTFIRGWLQAGVMADGVTRATVAGTPQGGMIAPLPAAGLHLFDLAWNRTGSGMLVRHADDPVILCRTQIVDLGEGREGFDLPGCHSRARVSGRSLERGIRRHGLHRGPSARSMVRVRARVKESTGRNRNSVKDVRVLIADIHPVLCGRGACFRTGNVAAMFRHDDRYVVGRLRRFPLKRRGRHLRPGRTRRWNEDRFNGLGLYRLRGPVRDPGAA